MTGTSSDAAFSDAYINETIKDIATITSIYNAGIANATETPTNKYVGRKGMNQSIYLGYTPAEYLDDVNSTEKKTDSSAD
jgi:L-amino acid N-acyltransferase YncA